MSLTTFIVEVVNVSVLFLLMVEVQTTFTILTS